MGIHVVYAGLLFCIYRMYYCLCFSQGSEGPSGPRGQPGDAVSVNTQSKNKHTHKTQIRPHNCRSITAHTLNYMQLYLIKCNCDVYFRVPEV